MRIKLNRSMVALTVVSAIGFAGCSKDGNDDDNDEDTPATDGTGGGGGTGGGDAGDGAGAQFEATTIGGALDLVFKSMDNASAAFKAGTALKLDGADEASADFAGCTIHSEPYDTAGKKRAELSSGEAVRNLFYCKYVMNDAEAFRGPLNTLKVIACVADQNGGLTYSETPAAITYTIKKATDTCLSDEMKADVPDSFDVKVTATQYTEGKWDKSLKVEIVGDSTETVYFTLDADKIEIGKVQDSDDKFSSNFVTLNKDGLAYESMYASAAGEGYEGQDTRHVRASITGAVDPATGAFSSIERVQGIYTQSGYGVGIIEGNPTDGFLSHAQALTGSDYSDLELGAAVSACGPDGAVCAGSDVGPFTDADAAFWGGTTAARTEYATWAKAAGPVTFDGDLPRTFTLAQ